MIPEVEALLDGTGWMSAALYVRTATCPLDSADTEALASPAAPIAAE